MMTDKDAKILVIDDEIMVTKTLKMILGVHGYKNVEAFNTPLEALEYLKAGAGAKGASSENAVDIMVSDFIMPKMNGIEFLAEAQKLQPNCTQILLTGYADKENAIRAINELGIYKYIEKPWNNDDLISNIKNGIERTRLKIALEAKIETLESTNAAIFDNCADGIVIFDEEMRLTRVNRATENLFGLDEATLKGKNFFELLINDKNQKFHELLEAREPLYLRDFSLVSYENEATTPVEISIAPVFNEYHSFFIGVIRDVSYQKENERLRDDFIATLTHDLRTPLLAAISGLEFVLNSASRCDGDGGGEPSTTSTTSTLGSLTEKQTVLLDTMKKSNEDMLGLVNALLEVYRYESGKLFLCKTQFCVNGLIKKCLKELAPLVQQTNGTKINFNFEDEEFIINADSNEIRRVIVNLVSNALKHGESATEVAISTAAAGKDISISVKDNGIGLTQTDCEKLFKRFSQGTSHKRTCSTGLGLYLSRQIVEAHNGKIWVESAPDKGSEFKFILKNAIMSKREEWETKFAIPERAKYNG